jgi:hypothetical protein
VGVGCVAFIILAVGVLGAVVYPVFVRARATARKAVCLSNVKNISLAMQMYASDNDDRFPPADEWCDTLQGYVKDADVYRCVSAPEHPCGYAYNAALSEVAYDALQDPTATIAVFESERGWNAAGGPELLAVEPRHLGGDSYGFADGRAAWTPREGVVGPGASQYRWEVSEEAAAFEAVPQPR